MQLKILLKKKQKVQSLLQWIPNKSIQIGNDLTDTVNINNKKVSVKVRDIEIDKNTKIQTFPVKISKQLNDAATMYDCPLKLVFTPASSSVVNVCKISCMSWTTNI